MSVAASFSMSTHPISTKDSETNPNAPVGVGNERETALQELQMILASRHFKTSDRSKQFLRFVVLNKLNGQTEQLKERSIGIELFHRPPGYATGEDPVVRVQAGEVRRRLEQYYQEAPERPQLRIELPLGSYSPVFHWGQAAAAREVHPSAAPLQPLPSPSWKPRTKTLLALAFVLLAAVTASAVFFSQNHVTPTASRFEQFWGPALASPQPVLICIANATDHSSEENIRQLSEKRLGSPGALEASPDSPAPGTDEKVTIEGLPISPEIVPAADASVAFTMSGMFGRLNKPSQLRIGTSATYEDLRSFPAVIIGGFNSKWTMQLVSNLHFAFLRDHGQYMIREEVPGGKVWTTRTGPGGETVEDFAIVARLIDSKTGQFTVTVAGIGPRGTEAAGEFVNSTRYLTEGLAGAPADWQNRNLEVLLQTTVTDSMAGPPHVIANYAW
jgi:hypothetical protein